MPSRHDYAVVSSRSAFRGAVTAMRSDVVRMPGGGVSQRDVVEHPGSVGVVALDEAERVLLVEQYRHPVRRPLLELPAGIRDVAGEPPLRTAERELLEEGGIRAREWHTLCDLFTSPGMSDEAIRVYLARDIEPVRASDLPRLADEELEMGRHWVALDQAVEWVLAGRVRNAMCAVGVLAARRCRDLGYAGLRPADLPWAGP